MKLTKYYICTHNEKKTTFSSLFDYMKTPFDRAQNIKDLFSLIAKEFGLEEDTNPYDFFKEHPNPMPEEINDEFDGTIIFSLFTEKFTLDLNVDDKIFPTSVKITDETKSKQLPNEVCENVLFLIKYDQQSFFNLFHQCQYVGELAALYDAASSFYETIATSFPSFRRELTLSGQRFTYFEAPSSSLLQPHYIELRSCKCKCLSSSTHYIATLTPSVFFFDSSPFRSHENTAFENFSTASRLSEIPSVYTNNDGIEVVQKDAFLSVFGTTMKISVNDSQIRKEVKVFSFLTLEELCSKLKQIKRQAAFNTLLKSLLDEKTFPSQTKEMNRIYYFIYYFFIFISVNFVFSPHFSFFFLFLFSLFFSRKILFIMTFLFSHFKSVHLINFFILKSNVSDCCQSPLSQ